MTIKTANPARRAAIALAITAAAAVVAVLVLGRAAYDWVKALHVIAIISWMAGMLYLPRLFIYHCEAETGSKQSETFKVMERRLLRVIINPAMIIAWITGLWLAWASGFWAAGWFHAETPGRGRHVRRTRLLFGIGPGLCRGPQRQAPAPLADHE